MEFVKEEVPIPTLSTEKNMKETGLKIKSMELENLLIRRQVYTMDTGRMVGDMEKESLDILMGMFIQDGGSSEKKKEQELTFSKMVRNCMEIGQMDQLPQVNGYFRMKCNTWENLKITSQKAMEPGNSKMEIFWVENTNKKKSRMKRKNHQKKRKVL